MYLPLRPRSGRLAALRLAGLLAMPCLKMVGCHSDAPHEARPELEATVPAATPAAAGELEPVTSIPEIPPGPPLSGQRPPDVILVTIDALRADHLPGYGYARDTAPALTALAAGGVVFTHAFACSSETRTSVPALLTGRFPPGPVWEEIPPSAGLAERLKSAGYRTGAFLGNAWLAPERGYRRGFDRFLSLDYVYPPPTQQPERRAARPQGKKPRLRVDGRNLVREAVSFLEASSRPTFLWLHLMDVHNPYQAPPPARWSHSPGVDRYQNGPMPMALQPEDLTWMRDRYDEGIRYTDEVLEPLWKVLRQPARAGRTLLIVTADHGEELGEHGGLGHGTSLYYELLHVPLIMLLPESAGHNAQPEKAGHQAQPENTGHEAQPENAGRGARVDRPVALWDLVPTVLGAAGQASPGLDGRDLRGLAMNADSPAARAVLPADRLLLNGVRSLVDDRLLLGAIQGPLHLIMSPEKDARRLFRWLEDPGERNDLARKPGVQAPGQGGVQGESIGAAGASQTPGGAGQTKRTPLDQAVKAWFDARGTGLPAPPLVTGRQEGLEALGYVGRP